MYFFLYVENILLLFYRLFVGNCDEMLDRLSSKNIQAFTKSINTKSHPYGQRMVVGYLISCS